MTSLRSSGPRPSSAWQLASRCRGYDSELFYGPEYEDRERRQEREAHAKQICQSCSVRHECLLHALVHVEMFGVWGGATPRERRRLIASGAHLAGAG